MSSTEVIYIGRDNEIVLKLSVNEVLINHSVITRCQLKVGNYLFDSTLSPNIFDFTQSDKIIFKLGTQTIPVGKYVGKLYIFDLDNENGVAWGEMPIIVKY